MSLNSTRNRLLTSLIQSLFYFLFVRIFVEKEFFEKMVCFPSFWKFVVVLLLLSDFSREVSSQSPVCVSDPSSAVCDSGHQTKLVIMTDSYGDETSWKITKDDGTGTFADFDSGSGYENNKLCIQIKCLPEGQYVFTIYDKFADGMCCQYGDGYYEVYLDGELLKHGSDFGASEVLSFSAIPSLSPTMEQSLAPSPLKSLAPSAMASLDPTWLSNQPSVDSGTSIPSSSIQPTITVGATPGEKMLITFLRMLVIFINDFLDMISGDIIESTATPSGIVDIDQSPSPSAAPSMPFQKTYHSCPDVGAESLEVVPDNGIFSILTTSNEGLCTLTLKTTTSTTETLAPLARSYNGHDWESVAGPYTISFHCNGNECDGSAPSIDQHTQVFLLTSFGLSTNLNSEDIAARFFEQTTFGTTRSDILPWKDQLASSSSSLDHDFAEWIKDQYDNVPATSLRQSFREQSSTKAINVKNAGVPLHVCDPNTRWRSYAISRTETTNDFGSIEVKRTSDDKYYLLSVNGVPRTEVESVEMENYGNLTVPGSYPTCFPFRYEER